MRKRQNFICPRIFVYFQKQKLKRTLLSIFDKVRRKYFEGKDFFPKGIIIKRLSKIGEHWINTGIINCQTKEIIPRLPIMLIINRKRRRKKVLMTLYRFIINMTNCYYYYCYYCYFLYSFIKHLQSLYFCFFHSSTAPISPNTFLLSYYQTQIFIF